jgi:hypothetical protein
VADFEDPLPPPPPHIVLLDDPSSAMTPQHKTPSPAPPTPPPPSLPAPQSNASASTYHQESYMAHRKSHHSPNGGYHRRSADNLLESSLNSHGTFLIRFIPSIHLFIIFFSFSSSLGEALQCPAREFGRHDVDFLIGGSPSHPV